MSDPKLEFINYSTATINEQGVVVPKDWEIKKAKDALSVAAGFRLEAENAEFWRVKAMQLEAELQGKHRREQIDTEITEILDRVSREVVAAWEQKVEKAVAQAKERLEELLIRKVREVFDI